MQKYGGTSVANAERILHVAERVTKAFDEGHRIVVVASAQGGVTDRLIKKAREVNPSAGKRELDMLLSTGEQQSVALLAMAIERLGYQAISLNAVQVGIHATDLYGNARIKEVQTHRILEELDRGKIVIVAGFQGVNRHRDLTTLGRGASDTTAVALSAVLAADLCEICKEDVDGVYSADPRVVASAIKLRAITYDDMLEMASSGAKVMHDRAVEMAKKFNVNVLVRSSNTDAPGTWIKERVDLEQLAVGGIAIDRNVARVSVMGLPDAPGIAYQVFSLLAEEKIHVDIICQSVGVSPMRDISFTVHKQDLDETRRVLNDNKKTIGFQELAADENLAKLSVIGTGMAANFGVAAAIFKALHENDINIHMISSSEIKISVLVAERRVTEAANAVHKKFESVFAKNGSDSHDFD